VFFSYPLDLDFAMLAAFPEAYQHPHPGGRGPRTGAGVVEEKKQVTLETGGNPGLYDDIHDDEFCWYPYLFSNRSKPEIHLAALSRIDPAALAAGAPPELKGLIEHIGRRLGLMVGDP
jgi:putative ATP-dependent endonuclease of the OLD family